MFGQKFFPISPIDWPLTSPIPTCVPFIYSRHLYMLPNSLFRVCGFFRSIVAYLITAFKIFKSLLDIDPNFFFLPSARRGLRGHPFKVLQGASHRRRRGSAFSVRVVKYWNKLPASVVFKKRLEKVWTELFPHWLNTYPPIPPAHHPLTVIISICNPTLCLIYVVSSDPLWPTFYHYKSLA